LLYIDSVARNYQMRIGTQKTRTTFDGFLRDDHERLSNLCKQYYNITIETKDTSVRGWNWGVAEVQGKHKLRLPFPNT